MELYGISESDQDYNGLTLEVPEILPPPARENRSSKLDHPHPQSLINLSHQNINLSQQSLVPGSSSLKQKDSLALKEISSTSGLMKQFELQP